MDSGRVALEEEMQQLESDQCLSVPFVRRVSSLVSEYLVFVLGVLTFPGRSVGTALPEVLRCV